MPRSAIIPNIIDVEASGFGSQSYPIEVGVALGSGEKYCSLILPHPDWTYWDEKAEPIHGISRSILEAYGKPLVEVANTLNDLLIDQTAYSDGWEVDNPWLIKLFYAAGIPKRFRISTLEFILTPSQMIQWHQTKDQVIEEFHYVRHRASQDALIIQQTFLKSRQEENSTK